MGRGIVSRVYASTNSVLRPDWYAPSRLQTDFESISALLSPPVSPPKGDKPSVGADSVSAASSAAAAEASGSATPSAKGS